MRAQGAGARQTEWRRCQRPARRGRPTGGHTPKPSPIQALTHPSPPTYHSHLPLLRLHLHHQGVACDACVVDLQGQRERATLGQWAGGCGDRPPPRAARGGPPATPLQGACTPAACQRARTRTSTVPHLATTSSKRREISSGCWERAGARAGGSSRQARAGGCVGGGRQRRQPQHSAADRPAAAQAPSTAGPARPPPAQWSQHPASAPCSCRPARRWPRRPPRPPAPPPPRPAPGCPRS